MEAFLESLGTPGPALFAVAGLFALAFLAARPWARRLGALDPAERAAVGLILGLDLVALAGFGLAWSDALAFVPLRWVFGAALVLAAVVGLRAARGTTRSFPWHALPFLALGVLFAAVGLAYPFSWDDLVYQVEVPLRWSAAGGLPVFADLPYSGFPGAFALLNLVLVRAGGVLAPAVFNAGLWLVLALYLQALLRARVGRWPSVALALAFALAWPAVMEAISAYAELFLALHLLALTSLALRGFEGPKAGARWAASGLASGVAAAIKLTGAIVPAWAGLLFVLTAWRARATREHGGLARRAACFLVPLGLVLACFYARPAVATGNPLHPYFAGWFGSDEAALATSTYHHDAGTAKFGVPLVASLATLAHFAASPFRLALGPFGDLGRFDGLLGLQFLALLLPLAALGLAWLRGRSVEPAWPWLAGAALLYAFWFLTSQQARFLLPACLLFTVAAAQGWALLARPLRLGLGVALPLLALVSIPARTYQHLALGLSVLAGKTSAVDYVESAQGDRYLPACQAILDLTPKDARLLLLYEHRGLYVPRAHWIGTPFFQERFFTPSEGVTERTFLATLAAAGITHVLVGYNPNDPDRMDAYIARTQPFQQLLVSLRGAALEVLWESREDATGDVRHGLYRVRDGARAGQGPTR